MAQVRQRDPGAPAQGRCGSTSPRCRCSRAAASAACRSSYEISGPDLDKLEEYGNEARRSGEADPGRGRRRLATPSPASPELRSSIDRERAADLGVRSPTIWPRRCSCWSAAPRCRPTRRTGRRTTCTCAPTSSTASTPTALALLTVPSTQARLGAAARRGAACRTTAGPGQDQPLEPAPSGHADSPTSRPATRRAQISRAVEREIKALNMPPATGRRRWGSRRRWPRPRRRS